MKRKEKTKERKKRRRRRRRKKRERNGNCNKKNSFLKNHCGVVNRLRQLILASEIIALRGCLPVKCCV